MYSLAVYYYCLLLYYEKPRILRVVCVEGNGINQKIAR
jgi:hypothetical protein